jgi:peptidoglycan/LPS O-acetylase OafA/YrhL
MLLYQQNWLFLGEMQMTQYLAVTWSLAIEEQFYILWPFIVYFAKREKLLKLTVWVIVLSLLSRILAALVWGYSSYFSLFFYFNSFTRFEEILVGALLAILFSDPAMIPFIRRYSLPAFLSTLSVFIFLCVLSYPNRPHPLFGNISLTVFGYTTAALFSASLIGVFVTHPEGSVLRRIFSSAPLVFFGKYSYSIYLFHMSIVLVLSEYFWHTKMRGWNIYLLYAALVFLLTALVGWLTWQLLEKHILGLKKYFEE